MTVEEREEEERMVSRSTKSQIVANHRKPSQTISNGRKRSQMIANGRKRSQMVANDRKRSQTIANGRKWSQTVANDRKWSQAIANGCKRSQTIADGRKRSQTVTNDRKWSLTIANSRKPSQMVANDRKWLQMVASCRKRSQMVANDCKWSQSKSSFGLKAYWPGPATLAQHLTDIGSVSACNRRQTSCYSQQTKNIRRTFVQHRPNVFDALYTCYTNFLCFLGWTQPSKHEALKWNESGFRPPLCTYRLNWAWRTSWGRDVEPVLVWCWASVADGEPALNQHLFASCLLGV